VTDPVRCRWANSDPLMAAYHDTEWGVPIRDSRTLWEMLMLEGFQAGLSWSIILKRREGFRRAFDGFDPVKVAAYDEAKVEALMADPGIIRARAKIEATIGGAKIFLAMRDAGEDFATFACGEPHKGDGVTIAASTPVSEAMSQALKKKGFKFCGPVIVHAWMQAVGMVDDHAKDCFRREEV
jgi:DNA-3-methyladenine glycosylase I